MGVREAGQLRRRRRPAVDVYIDDGRAGEYQFQQVHWANQSMWNRNAPDGLAGHQNAVSRRRRTTCT